MSRKTRVLTLALGGICCFGVSRASADSFLPGNVWPNADLSVAATPGVDQVYGPNVTGDANPRPDGWHRGGSDFGVTTTPSFCFYNTTSNTASEGVAPAGLSDGNALQVSDSSTNGYGEWFSDWNALPASVIANPGESFVFQFFVQYQNVSSTQRPVGSDQFRVSADFGDAVGDDVTTFPNNLGHTDYIIPDGSPDQTSWLQVDETLTAPAGAASMRVTVASGGSNSAEGQIWVTDISVAEVPEPTSLGLLAGGALLLAKRRRRA